MARQEGQIIEKVKGKKYSVRVFIGYEGERRKYHNKTINGSRKEAQAYLTEKLHEKNQGLTINPAKITVSEYMDKWLNTSAKGSIREKTLLDYEDRIRLYVTPAIGNVKLTDLKSEQVQQLYNDMQEVKGLSARTVRYVHSILNSAFNQAVAWDYITSNPVEKKRIKLPKQTKKEMKYLTPEQARQFMDAAVYSEHKALFNLLLVSGMRPGEALGLKWQDVDFDNKRVTVRRVLSRVHGKALQIIEDTKTAKSKRTIPLTGSVMDDLKEIKQEHDKAAAERKAAEKWNLPVKEYNDQDLIFCNEQGSPIDESNIYKRHFKPLLKDAGLPEIRLYDLRHTTATLLLSAGENPKVVSERLGHSTITLTMDVYSHVMPTMQEGATSKLEGMLSNAK